MEKRIELNIEQIIADYYLEIPHTRFESYKYFNRWELRFKKLYNNLSDELKKEVRELDDLYSEFEAERIEECVKFSIETFKKLIGIS